MSEVRAETELTVRGHFVGGEWVKGSDGLASVDPCQPDRVVGTFPEAENTLIDQAVTEAGRAQRAWRRLSLPERVRVLDAFVEELENRADGIARLITAEMGKPIREARQEAAALVKKWALTRKVLDHELSPVSPEGVHGFWDWRAIGVMAVIGPFNFPVHLSNGHILPALAAGNAVVLKPSETAPGCGQLYVEAWEAAARKCGVNPAVLSLLQGGGATGAALVEHAGLGIVAFTGSLSVGKRILAALAERPWVLPALEMGGKNAAIVLDDTDVELAARRIALGAWQTTGQRCTATSRVVIQRGVEEAFLEAFLAETRKWQPEDPLEPDARMGPLATEGAFRRFVAAQEQLDDGLEPLLSGGGCAGPTATGWWVKPAVHRLSEGAQVRRWREELFGPEVLVKVVDSDEEALSAANDSDFGLAISVFSSDRARFDRLRPELDAGLVHWNRSTAGASSAMPFGGTRGSGNHRAAGILSLRYCVHPVATLLDDPEDDER